MKRRKNPAVLTNLELEVMKVVWESEQPLTVRDVVERLNESRERALTRAAGIRLRPILMTSATTCLALAPLAISTGEAAALRSPLAITVIFGIITSTIGSLLVIPCVYSLLDRISPTKIKAVP